MKNSGELYTLSTVKLKQTLKIKTEKWKIKKHEN